MIKGIYFKERPWIFGVSLEKVLEDLNYLEEVNNQEVTDRNGYIITLKQFNGKKYKARIYESENEEGIDAIEKMYTIINTAVPDFLQSFKISNKKVMVVFSNFSQISKEQETFMDLFIDELVRVSVVVIKQFGEDNVNDMIKFIKDYVDICTYCPDGYSNEDDFLEDLFN